MARKKFYSTQKLVILILVLGLGLAAYFFATSAGKAKEPQQFLEARKNAADVSANIVGLTNSTDEKIKAINLSDLKGNSEKALALVQEARATNTEAYKSAFELSRGLQTMAEALAQIKSLDNRRLAYDAVAVELSLVSEFINYTGSLNNFLDILNRAITTNSPAERLAAENYLKEINKNTEKINNLNQEFLTKIGKFDKGF